MMSWVILRKDGSLRRAFLRGESCFNVVVNALHCTALSIICSICPVYTTITLASLEHLQNKFICDRYFFQPGLCLAGRGPDSLCPASLGSPRLSARLQFPLPDSSYPVSRRRLVHRLHVVRLLPRHLYQAYRFPNRPPISLMSSTAPIFCHSVVHLLGRLNLGARPPLRVPVTISVFLYIQTCGARLFSRT
ncbi:hypothetical protein PLICRDRAFT_445304 [Plicaturopsis crispa FD-325 SS-3]|uniref:Uncharacterized protein n=1 Tax=Plicaturopsis crispa FD-325 SS-3 TaxID=944288 RepID=A0A0C9T674_PLICR|nr:hypothetical protein PLICRDRAFT_445304 [Plicaturopsis crispa FD-325 SS-3]